MSKSMGEGEIMSKSRIKIMSMIKGVVFLLIHALRRLGRRH